MRKLNLILICLLLISSFSFISAESSDSEVSIYYFYGNGCSACARVSASGVLEKLEQDYEINIIKYEVYYNNQGRELFTKWNDNFGIPQDDRKIPFTVFESNVGATYIKGTSIIDNLEQEYILHLNGSVNPNFTPINPNAETLTLWSIIIAAIIDSINPCAFGVLIFLMLTLLSLGSSKRALRAGLLYTFVVFLVYFLAGFGIFKAIQTFTSITNYIYLAAGILVLILGLWQFKDVFLPKFGPSLAISSKAKPLIQKIIKKGTIPAMILLGIVVAIFELPCTGGIYLGILTVMAINKTFGIGYLLLYNLIFVLPLIILTFVIYKGTSPETLQKWTQKERKWMKLAAGVVLILLGLYILVF